MAEQAITLTRGAEPGLVGGPDPDPVSTEILTHALKSAAQQMYITLVRTSVSPVIYATVDFSLAIFDHRGRMLSQSPGIAFFMASMTHTLESALRLIGGSQNLQPGDVIMHNVPYETGTHANDSAFLSPVFDEQNNLVAYVSLKLHLSDMAGKAPYITDSSDVYQEGTFYPAIKLFKAGKLDEEWHRMLMNNTRAPKQVWGDIAAAVSSLRTGSDEVLRILKRFGRERFETCVEHMLNQGESRVRGLIEAIPDGIYSAGNQLDNDGVNSVPIPLKVSVEVRGSDVTVDFTECPDAVGGPYNCPRQLTASAAAIAITMLAGKGDIPTDGHFRAISIKTRPGSIYHPLRPSPCFVGSWSAMQAVDMILLAMAKADPEVAPAGSHGDACGTMLWGYRDGSTEAWVDGQALPGGQGGSVRGDGVTHCHIGLGAQAITPVEDWDHKWPVLTECVELIPDSSGAGRYRGGFGIRLVYRALEDMFATTTLERSTTAPWGLAGGNDGNPNLLLIHYPDGTSAVRNKGTGLNIPKGSLIETRTGGGGGYGDPADRRVDALVDDYIGGYISRDYLVMHYPQADDVLRQAEA
jgi:N-methylhydantoinase B